MRDRGNIDARQGPGGNAGSIEGGLSASLTSPRPSWHDVINAADWLRTDMDISKSLWGEACVSMGRQQAAVAIGLLSAKPATHFRSTPGGYFNGMVMKAKAGDLNLARTIWGLRHARTSRRGASRSPS